MKNIWMIITRHEEAAPLMDLLKLPAENVTALVVGDRALAEEVSGVVKAVQWMEAEAPADCYASAAAKLLAEAHADLLIAAASPASRNAIGIAAAMLNVPLVSNVIHFAAEENGVIAERSAVDGKQIETVKLPVGACVLVNPIHFKLQEIAITPNPDRIAVVSGESNDAAEYLAVSPVAASSLTIAERIVSVGMGATKEELFNQAKVLAEKMGAELGCSMPVATEYHMLPHENYIGISGCKVAPKLYVALGVSGTVQHCAGVNNANTIVVINKDPNAPFFRNADYGIVGDLNEVLPALIEALG